MWKRAFCAVLAAPGLGWAAPTLATVTIVDSGDPVVLIRDISRHKVAEGVRLQKEDILESGPQARLVRVEFASGVVADLGPDTRVLLGPKLAGDRSKSSPAIYLLHGWAKLSTPDAAPAVMASLSSQALDIANVARRVVVSVSPTEAYVFAEAGSATLVERVDRRPALPLTLKSDQFFARAGNGKPTVTSRPSGAFVARVPKPFLDTLPSRLTVFAGRDVNPKRLGDISYADAQPWIDAEAALRPAFLSRWRDRAQVPEFRQGLVADMKAHPEWDRVVYPERYLPKRPARDTPAAGYSR